MASQPPASPRASNGTASSSSRVPAGYSPVSQPPPSSSSAARRLASPTVEADEPLSAGAFNPAHIALHLADQAGQSQPDGAQQQLARPVLFQPQPYSRASLVVSPEPIDRSSTPVSGGGGGGAGASRAMSPLSPGGAPGTPRGVGSLVRPAVVPKREQPRPSWVYVPSNFRYLCVGAVQMVLIWLLYTFTAYQIGIPWQVFLKIRNINAATVSEDEAQQEATVWDTFTLFLWIMPSYAILFPFSLGATVLVKWLVIGRYKEGRYKLWSLYYLRWWFVQRITGLVPLVYLRGSIMMNLYARAMGMKVGRNVFLNSFHCEAWDLIELGEDASIGCDAHLANFHVENGYLTISRIRVGARAYVGVRSIVQGDCTIEADGHLAAMSLLSHGKTIPRGQAWRGAPAKKVADVDNKFRHEDETPEENEEEEWTGGASDEEKQGGAGGGRRMRNNKPASATAGANSLNEGLMSDAGSSGSNVRRWGRPSMCRLFWLGFAQFWFLCGVLSSIILVSASPGLVAIHYIMDLPGSDLFPSISTVDVWWQYFAVIPIMAITFVIIFLLQVTVLKNILMRNTQPGDHSIYSFWYLRKWCVDVLLQLSLHTVYTMYATMYLPPWLRTLGAKLGKGTEVSTAADYCPDLLDIGDGCFVADSVYLGVPTVYMGVVRMAQLKVGSRTFLGNGACLSLDSDIGSDALLGVMSTPPPVKPVASSAPGGGMSKEEAVALSKAPITWPETRTLVSDNTSYLGSPPMLLPRRQQAQGNFDVASTFQPTKWLHVQRLTWEFFRITLPFMFISALMLMYMGNFEYILFENDDTYAELALFWIVIWPACYIGAAVVCCFLVLLFKWVLVGTYVPGEAPLWSHFVWRTELCVGLMESLANPFFINHLRGTPFVCMWFRLLGSTVGERVWMDTTQITEPDLVHIGHDVVLQQDCTLQTHLFEDRIMKMSNLHVDNFCSVGTMSVLLYDSHMREGSHIGDLSLLMKGEQLEPWTRSEGIPCQPIRK